MQPYKKRLSEHRIYSSIRTQEETRIFMENHIFAVWDFMSLVKRLQNDLTCTTIPWVPFKDPKSAHFINQIVLGEECDDFGTHDANSALSHFELYIKSMNDIEADTKPINYFMQQMKNGEN